MPADRGHIGHYRVGERLGAGGMGEVFRATDTKLGRQVALKVLPEAFAEDAERMTRFEREAQLLASLNHPNIAVIYGVEDAGKSRALVMELVEGPTLAERIAQGPLPLEEARERLEAATFHSAVDYIKALRLRTVLMEEMRGVFQTCDVLMLPAGNAAPKLEAEIGATDAPADPPLPPRPDSYNIANVTGIPAIALPCGFTAGPPSLPLGIQFCAKPFDEATLFRIAHAYQSATDWHRRRPPLTA